MCGIRSHAQRILLKLEPILQMSTEAGGSVFPQGYSHRAGGQPRPLPPPCPTPGAAPMGTEEWRGKQTDSLCLSKGDTRAYDLNHVTDFTTRAMSELRHTKNERVPLLKSSLSLKANTTLNHSLIILSSTATWQL